MNKRFISVLVFAFVVAAGASLTVYRLLIGRINTNAAAQTVKILVASRNLQAGAILSARDLQPAPWLGDIPEGAFLNAADLPGRAVATPIYSGEPLTEKRLGSKGSGGGLASTIPTGMRAAAIRVNDLVGVAGFVVPGAHVDVLVSGGGSNGSSLGGIGGGVLSSLGLPSLSIPTGAPSGPSGTHTLLQNILVLSAGQDFRQDSEGKPVSAQVVNLLVTPVQAEMLSLASNQLTLQLVLRNPVDTGITNTPGVTMSNIFTAEELAEKMPPVRMPSYGPSLPGPSTLPTTARPATGGSRSDQVPEAKPVGTKLASVRPASQIMPAKQARQAPEASRPTEPSRMEIIEGSKRTDVALQGTGAN